MNAVLQASLEVTKTLEEQITEDVLEAYRGHDLRPTHGSLLSRSWLYVGTRNAMEVHTACAVGALAYEEIVDKDDHDRSQWDYADKVMAERYGWGHGQAMAFAYGFDAGYTGLKPAWDKGIEEHYMGYRIGQRVREEFRG